MNKRARPSSRAARASTSRTTRAGNSSRVRRGCGAPRSAIASERLAQGRLRADAQARLSHTLSPRRTRPASTWRRSCCQIAPVPMSKVLFQCSGSEANDTAIKLVWYYHAAIGKPGKTQDHRPQDGLSRQHLGRDQRLRQARHARRFRPAVPGVPPHRIPALLPPPRRRRERGAVRHAHGGRAGSADRREKAPRRWAASLPSR